MAAINKGEIFLKAVVRTLIVGVGELPLVGLPLKMGAVFWKQWVTELKAAQDALPDAERPVQLEEAAAYEPSAVRSLARTVIQEVGAAGTVLNQEQQEAVLDLAAVLPGRIRERTRATLAHAKRQGTVAHLALPISTRAPVPEREDFYRSLLPPRRLQHRPGEPIPHGNPEWQLVELLGSGGFGEVWLARHEDLGDTRAVKFCQDQTAPGVLQREVENLKLLRRKLPNHPHIVSFYESQLKFEPYWLQFEYVPGGTLEALIRNRAWSWPEAIRFLTPLWQAMVHELGIVHRDLKPVNIFLDAKGLPKIGDFGIGKILAEREAVEYKTRRSQAFTTTGYGSIGYMSPEQEGGEPAHPADDTYAMGVILYQMLVGTVGRTPTSLDDIQELAIPELGQKLLLACRFYRRDKRPQHAGALLQLLSPILAAAPPPPPVLQPKPQPQTQHQPLPPPQPKAIPQPPSSLVADIQHGHYLIHSNGTVTDTRTSLMWKRCAEGQTWDGTTCVGKGRDMTWNDIVDCIIESRGFLGIGRKEIIKQKHWPAFAGYDDWRVPTKEELGSLVYCSNGTPKHIARDKSCGGKGWLRSSFNFSFTRPTIDTTAFPNTASTWFWSASAVASDSTSAWNLNFNDGSDLWNNRSYANPVRLVRGGR